MPAARSEVRLRAAYMRGGTSKGLIFLDADLPADRSAWDELFLAALGSPDPYGRQLDGMGGGISSLSKVCIVGPAIRANADIDYTFGQVLVSDAKVDYSGNCGNMSSAVGPFALMRGLVAPASGESASVTIHNTNTGKLIRATFPADGPRPIFTGSFAIDGVSGTGAPIRLDFLEPGGSRNSGLLPTGVAAEKLHIAGKTYQVSLVDAATPCIFVDARDLNLSTPPLPEAIDSDGELPLLLETIRRQASVRMGIAAGEVEATQLPSVPKVAIVFAPQDHGVLSGRKLNSADMNIAVRMMSMGKAHRALPITGAICLAAALRLPGSVPARLASVDDGLLTIAHSSGLISVDAEIENAADSDDVRVRHASVVRTARCLFDGVVYC